MRYYLANKPGSDQKWRRGILTFKDGYFVCLSFARSSHSPFMAREYYGEEYNDKSRTELIVKKRL